MIFASWLISYLRRPYSLPEHVSSARWPLFLFACWLLYLVIQVIPLPAALVQQLNPSTYALYAYAADSSIKTLQSLSIDRGATITELFKTVSYIALFFLTLVLIDSRERLKQLIMVLFCVGLSEAIYGMLVSFSNETLGLWSLTYPYTGPSHLNAVSGTYISHNNFAGLMELTIPLGLAMSLYHLRPPRFYPNWKARLRSLSQFVMERGIRLYLFVVIMFAALFLSTSRGGTIALFTALGISVFIAIIKSGQRAKEMRFVPTLLLLMIFAGLWFGVEGLNEKFLHTVSSGFENSRIPVYQASLKLIENQPVFGSGAGSYRWLFPLYRNADIGLLFFDHAHNDYLEFLAEQGIVGFAILGTAITLLLITLIRAYTSRRDPLAHTTLFAVLTASLALLIHGLLDFNFQIPANSGYFYVIIAMGVVAKHLPRRKPRKIISA